MPGADMGEYFAELEVSYNGSETPTFNNRKTDQQQINPALPSTYAGESQEGVADATPPPPTTPWGGRPVRHRNLGRRGVGYR